MICRINREGEFSLVKTTSKTKLYEHNIKYNFIIQPMNNNEKFKCSGKGSYIMFTIPTVLDFTLNDQIYIYFRMYFSFDSKYISLDPQGNDLQCQEYDSNYKRCTIHKDYFKYKNSGTYYTYHYNHVYNYIKFYESTPFKVILPDIYLKIKIKKEMNGDKIRIINSDSGLLFILVTDFINKGGQYSLNNINYSPYYKEKDGYARSAYCKLWAPKDDNLRIICKINEFTPPSQIFLEKNDIKKSKYTITIEQDNPILIDSSHKAISFL